MRSSKINYIIVGLFIIISIGGLLGATILLSGRTGAIDSYYTVYNNVTGVKFGTQIVYEGFPIGQVTEVTPTEENGRMRFRVDFDIIHGWKIPEDSEVEIAAPGLLAAVNLAIHSGMSMNPLKPGEKIKSRERADLFSVFSDLAGQFNDLTNKYVKPLILNISDAVKSTNELLELRHEGHAMIVDTRKALSRITSRIPAITSKFESLLGNLHTATKRFNSVVSLENTDKLVVLIDNLNAASQKIDTMMVTTNSMLADIDDLVMDENGDVKKSFSDTRYVVESIARNIDSINQNMNGAARNLNEFTRQIRNNPGLLLGGSAPVLKEEN